MSIVVSTLDGNDLPDQTTYVVNRPKRTQYQETFSGGQFNSKGTLVVNDFTIDIRIPDTDKAAHDLLKGLYDADSDYEFYGHHDLAADKYNVHIEEFTARIEAGLYQLTVALRVLSVIT